MYNVVIVDFGGDIWDNKFTGISVTSRCFSIESINPQGENAVYIIPNNVVDTFIDQKTGAVRLENVGNLGVYNKNNYTKSNSINNLGGYTIPLIFNDLVNPITPGDNYVSSEVKKFLFSLGRREVAPSIRSYLISFINELNKGTITENKLDRVSKFLKYFGAKVKRIEIGAMSDVELAVANHQDGTVNTSQTPPTISPSTTGVIIR